MFRIKSHPKYIGLVVLIILTIGSILFSGPSLKESKVVVVEKGGSVKAISKSLKAEGIIRSESLFSSIVVFTRLDDNLVAGEYVFTRPQNIFSVIYRLSKGKFDIKTVDITLTEGMTRLEMAKVLQERLPNFNTQKFLSMTEEGYVFPDTYKFFQNDKTEVVIDIIKQNFDAKLKQIQTQIDASKYSLEQIIIMASIVEREATADSRQEVANILWKRYELGMPLQVDAPFVYVLGKGTFDLTLDDLRKDSEYNTYTRKGLTPTAISNPGLISIKATAAAQPTQYLYFLTGRDGKMYYARNFAEHKNNRALYLD